MVLEIDDRIFRAYTGYTQAPILTDTDLDAWADLYQRERLYRVVYFDIFMFDPVHYCLANGIVPRPHDNGALPMESGHRLLPAQRYVAARIP